MALFNQGELLSVGTIDSAKDLQSCYLKTKRKKLCICSYISQSTALQLTQVIRTMAFTRADLYKAQVYTEKFSWLQGPTWYKHNRPTA